MDEFYLICGVTLTVECLVTFYFSVQYFKFRNLCSAYTTSLESGINAVTDSDVKTSDKPQYAVVRGHVKAIGPPIKSLNQSSVNGVIQKLTVKEHSVRKNGFGIWFDQQHIIDTKLHVVPFEIKDGKYRVTVTSPLDAHYLNLEVIEDHFEPSVSSFFNLLFGIHQKGFQYTEFLLKENSIVTGFGELTLDNRGNLQLIPPRNTTGYILSTMDPETLTHQLKTEKRFCKINCFVFGFIAVCVAGIIAYKLWKDNQNRRRLKLMKAEAMRQRQSRNINLNEDSFTCIVCFNLPREVVCLPCGHISLCFNCSEQLPRPLCPVCRQNIQDIRLIFVA